MILDNPNAKAAPAAPVARATLDDLFRRAAARRPDAMALIDPPNREGFTDGAPRRLTYAQTDRIISAIAGRLRRIGLHTDAIVGLQMANTVDSVVALLAVLRAGLIAMPLPLLWRRADAVAALGHVGAQALIVTGRIGTTDHFDLALQVAAETFAIRHVCAFGRSPPDGIAPLDDLYAADTLDPIPSIERERALPPGPGAHLALITWDVAPGGLVPVARSHAEMIAGALGVSLEAPVTRDAVILSTLTMSSFAGLAATLVPWLHAGGTLALHHPFDDATFLAQRRSLGCDTIVLPGPMVGQFAEAGHLAAADGLRSVIGVWRAPERLQRAATWCEIDVTLTDVRVFGETGALAARRGPNGRPAAIHSGPVTAPRNTEGALAVAEVATTAKGTLAMRGPMVPRCAFPAGAERTSLPHFMVPDSGFVDTGYPCRTHKDSTAMAVIGGPPGIASVGGYRFMVRDLEETVGSVECDGTLAVLPDLLAGHRLAGSAPDPDYTQEALTRLGVNPLLVNAFAPSNQWSVIGDQQGGPSDH